MTTPIINQIEDMVRDIPGWTPIDQLYTLFTLVYLARDLPGDVVEIGSWCGRSAVVLAKAAQQAGSPRVHCIDLFPAKEDWRLTDEGTYCFESRVDGTPYGAYMEQTVWKEPFEKFIAPLYERYDSVLDCFRETIERQGFQDLVVSHRGVASTFLKEVGPEFRCKVLFIDADHGYEAVCNDIRTMEPCLVEGGWICFDDAFSVYEGTNRAIQELIIDSPAFELGQQMTRKFFIARKKPASRNR